MCENKYNVFQFLTNLNRKNNIAVIFYLYYIIIVFFLFYYDQLFE